MKLKTFEEIAKEQLIEFGRAALAKKYAKKVDDEIFKKLKGGKEEDGTI